MQPGDRNLTWARLKDEFAEPDAIKRDAASEREHRQRCRPPDVLIRGRATTSTPETYSKRRAHLMPIRAPNRLLAPIAHGE